MGYVSIPVDVSGEIATHAALTQNVHGVGANDIADVADISTHAGLLQNVHGVGANDIADVADISTHAGLDTGIHGSGANTLLDSGDKNVANGVPGLDASGLIVDSLLTGIGKKYSISDDLLHSHDAEASSGATGYTKLKTITLSLNPDPSTLRIKFELKGTGAAATAYGKIYKNGGAVGTERTTGGNSYVLHTQDISFADGDTLELYVKKAGGGTTEVKNFRVYGLVTDLTLVTAIEGSDCGGVDGFGGTNS